MADAQTCGYAQPLHSLIGSIPSIGGTVCAEIACARLIRHEHSAKAAEEPQALQIRSVLSMGGAIDYERIVSFRTIANFATFRLNQ